MDMHRIDYPCRKLMRAVIFSLTAYSALTTSVAAEQKPYVSVEDLTNLRDIGGHAKGAVSVSPDGKWIAFQLQTANIDEGDYGLSWMTLPVEGGVEPTLVADGGDVILNPNKSLAPGGNRGPVKAKWSPDSSQFAYTLQNADSVQIWTSRPNRKANAN